jgi:hypothetical protein
MLKAEAAEAAEAFPAVDEAIFKGDLNEWRGGEVSRASSWIDSGHSGQAISAFWRGDDGWRELRKGDPGPWCNLRNLPGPLANPRDLSRLSPPRMYPLQLSSAAQGSRSTPTRPPRSAAQGSQLSRNQEPDCSIRARAMKDLRPILLDPAGEEMLRNLSISPKKWSTLMQELSEVSRISLARAWDVSTAVPPCRTANPPTSTPSPPSSTHTLFSPVSTSSYRSSAEPQTPKRLWLTSRRLHPPS